MKPEYYGVLEVVQPPLVVLIFVLGGFWAALLAAILLLVAYTYGLADGMKAKDRES